CAGRNRRPRGLSRSRAAAGLEIQLVRLRPPFGAAEVPTRPIAATGRSPETGRGPGRSGVGRSVPVTALPTPLAAVPISVTAAPIPVAVTPIPVRSIEPAAGRSCLTAAISPPGPVFEATPTASIGTILPSGTG